MTERPLTARRSSAGRVAFAAAALSLAHIATGALPTASALHEDDPKVLDRKAPIAGTGILRGAASGGGPTVLAGSGPFDANGISLSAWLTTSDLGQAGENGNDCWGYVSPSGREYAIICTTSATVVVEVTNPTAPTVVGTVDGPNSLWRDVKTYDSYAYSVTEGGGGIQVIDLSNVDSGQVSLANTVNGPGSGNTHNVAIDTDSGFLYRTGGSGNGLRIYDLSNPANPTYVGEWQERYVHDAQIVTYTTGPYAGRQIAYCCSGFNNGYVDTGLTVLDVTDKSNPFTLSQVPYPSREYSHQGWLSEDRTLFYLGDELDEGASVSTTTTRVFDVSDPGNASYIGAFDNGNTAIGHNMYTRDGLLYQANYTSGLRVFDVASDPTSPAEVAYFDTAPGGDGTSFNGLWSVYPYLPSGTIIGSDIEGGLFVLQLDGIRIEGVASDGTLSTAGETVTATVTGEFGSVIDPNSIQLRYDAGAGYTSIQMVATGNPDEYSASFPALPCGTAVDWYVQAGSVGGGTATVPAAGQLEPFQDVVVDGLLVARSDDMETAAGWVGGAPGDTATTGIWERGDPVGTAAQPEDDASPIGAQCWFTGQGAPGGSLGANDVDGGATTLLTPVIDMSSLLDPRVGYSRWYSNDQGGSANADVFRVDISNDGGANWTSLELVGPGGPGTSGGWIPVSFRVQDVITPTATMQLRFIAEDIGGGSIVEAAIDDFEVVGLDCGGAEPGQSYCQANPNSTGAIGVINGSGSNVVADNALDLLASDLPPNQFGFFVVSESSAFVPNPGGSVGNLCVGAPTGRYNAQITNSGPAGEIALSVDLTSIPLASASVAALPGETWYFQCWHRDVSVVQTSNFTRGYQVTFQ